jgi:pantetheine-phosphate adenylyltransferase
MAQMNQQLSGVDTLSCRPALNGASSRGLAGQEIATYGGDVAHLLPPSAPTPTERIAERA